MANLTCDLCNKTFSQKNDFTRHKNKKKSCVSLDKMMEITQTIQTTTNTKSSIILVFKSCLNILRDSEGFTGVKALGNITKLFILKLIEPRIIKKEINLDDYADYTITDEANKIKLLKLARFSNLSSDTDSVNTIACLWRDILSVHPKTKQFYVAGKGFDIINNATFVTLIAKINSIDYTKVDLDVLGGAYEEVMQDILTGKVLGQYFTQPLVKKIMVDLIDPQVFEDGTFETCGDPAMGTCGLLSTYLNCVVEKAKKKNIKLNWDFAANKGVYGKEFDNDTFNLGLANMLISSGQIFETLECGDSIRVPINKKFDNILANPPFGIKGLKYDDFHSSLKFDYTPIKSDNGVSLFIQAIIYMLNINGKCVVVLPDGKDLTSTNPQFIAIREYLLKTCDLLEVIYLPPGVFTYTPIKTCIYYFVKKCDEKSVITSIPKNSKTNKETGERVHKFITDKHQTSIVKFYECNPYTNVKLLLVEVPIERIIENSYILNYSDYIESDTDEDLIESDIPLKTLGELCSFLPKSKRSAKYGKNEGTYPFFKSSNKVDSYVTIPDYKCESLIIGDGGEPNINHGINFSASDHCYILQNKDSKSINLKYVYYYLFNNLHIMKRLYTGVGIKNIAKKKINSIKIPILPIAKQNEIVANIDKLHQEMKQLQTQISDKMLDIKKCIDVYTN
jgi:type I restriction-modification system DNA methylase subunit